MPTERTDPRPKFARSFPKDPTLDSLLDAFVAGDYARVRKDAPSLAASTEDDDVRRAALELRRRIDPDPLSLVLVGLAALLLLLLAGYYWTHKEIGP